MAGLVEASQIAIDLVEAGNDTSGQPHEECIGGPDLQPEDTILATAAASMSIRSCAATG